MDLLHVGATWLHLLATVALLGYYAILGLVVLPVIRRLVPARELSESIAAIQSRATPIVGVSLLAFLATGVYLMVTADQYEGLGSVSGSAWAALFLVKHLVIGVMVGIGVYIDALVVRRFAGAAGDQAASIRRLTLATVVMTILGALVLLLTAAGQAS
ncbi:MAG: hypothetical protein L0227_16620 [Chloroflexi bacterium]|nr:hypothetical protein [Chloroflexota bacterium]